MKISQRGLDFIKSWEGCKLKAYKCPAGVWTIGVGHTGKDVYEGLKITEEEAMQLLDDDLNWAEVEVLKGLKVELSQDQFDALVSFVFNVGDNAYRHSTLFRKLNSGDVAGAALHFKDWNKIRDPHTGKLKVSKGLTNRRQAEYNLFMDL